MNGRIRVAGPITGAVLGIGILLSNSMIPAHAQQSEIDALKAQLKALQERLDKLEAEQKKTTEAASKVSAPAVTTGSKVPLTVTGLLQVHGNAFFDQNSALPRQPDTFRLRRAEVRITAPQITSRISGTVMIDPAKALNINSFTTPAAGTAVTPTVNQSSNVLQELMLSYRLHSNPRTSHFVDVGQFKLPIGYEGDLVSSSALQGVERALMFQARDPFGGSAGDIRDTGAELRGTLNNQLDYRLGIFNGFGERQNALAGGDPKAVIGRLAFRPQGINGLQLGVSGGVGDTRNTPASGGLARRDLFNLFGVYKRQRWTWQNEYLTGRAQTVVAAPGVTRNIRGYYSSLGYMFRPRLEGVLRYEYFDFDRNLIPAAGASADTAVRDLIFGVNYYIKGNNAKIQANIVRRNGGAGLVAGNGFTGNPTGFNQDRTELRTNFQVAF